MARQTNKVVVSDPLRYSPALELQYKRELRGLVDKMLKDVARVIVESYAENKQGFALDGAFKNVDDQLKDLEKKYKRIFEQRGEEYAKKMVMRQFRFSRSTFRKVMEKLLPKDEQVPSLAGSVIPRETEQVIKASIMENVSLIKSIQQQYFERITGSVARSMQAGGSIKQLRAEILKYNGMSKRRADNIAYDQTRKAYNSINLRNLEKVGVKKVKWIHSGGGQTVREYHYRKWDGVSGLKDGRPNGLNGFIFDVDNPPVIQKAEGSQQEIRGYPAQLPNCKCIMAAVVEIEGV